MVRRVNPDKKLQAYIIGVALGDGNLSNPNGRALRLRITCDNKYPKLKDEIKSSLQLLFPDNKVSETLRADSCTDVYCYSNNLKEILGWNSGSKLSQNVRIPGWITKDSLCAKECLRGLFQTDGSMYLDRGYNMVNFTSQIPTLAQSVSELLIDLGYRPNIQKRHVGNQTKYTIRISKNTERFIEEINLWKE